MIEFAKINATDTSVSTSIGGYVGDGGVATNGCLNSPENIAFDSSGNSTSRKVTETASAK